MVFPLDIIPKTYTMFTKSDELRFVKVRKFSSNPQICPVLAVQKYISRTTMLRPDSCKHLFITTQAPYRPAAPMTARRWILSNLSDAGISIDNYSSTSTRHASSSKAFCAGINVDLVMRRAGWLNLSSFVLHYNLPIKDFSEGKRLTAQSRKDTPRTKIHIKNYFNAAASKVLQRAKMFSLCKSAQFDDQPFVDVPSPVPWVHLPAPVRVTMYPKPHPKSGSKKRKLFVMYTRSIPVVDYTPETVPDNVLHHVSPCSDTDQGTSTE